MTANPKAVVRCAWAGNRLSARYHDEEWGVPVHSDHTLFEFLVLEGAQAGLSWNTILNKRENCRAAFDGFNPLLVARYGGRKAQQLLQDPGIVRNPLPQRSKMPRRFFECRKRSAVSTATSGSLWAAGRK